MAYLQPSHPYNILTVSYRLPPVSHLQCTVCRGRSILTLTTVSRHKTHTVAKCVCNVVSPVVVLQVRVRGCVSVEKG